MEYNNYYPAPVGPHPPPPHMQPNQQQGGGGPGGYSQLMPGANSMMIGGPGPGPPPHPPPQGMRQVVTPGPPPGHPQMQQQQPHPPQSQQPPPPSMMGHQHMQQQQHHPGYHQHPPPPHPHPLPHSGSPHLNQQQPNINMNLQPPSRPSTGPSPQHPMHQQSPHLVSGPPPPPPMHMHPQPPQQQLNHVGGPPSGPPNMNQPPSSMPQHPHQNFMSPGPVPPPHQHPSPHYNQPIQHQRPPSLPPSGPNNQGPPPPLHHHHPGPPQGPPPPQPYLPHQSHINQSAMERGSPFYQNIPQTEIRIIELNKRLQSRPRPRGPAHPLPQMDTGESYWWEKFACDFFDSDATLILRTSTEDKPVNYTIGRTLIPRFFRSYFDGGAVDLSIKLRSTREIVNHHLITLECDQADIVTKNVFKYRDMPMNIVVHTEGHLSLDFVSNSFDTLVIKSWRFYTNQCREYVDRSMTTAPGLPPTFLNEPVTRYGLTKQTISYLKMCMIMEPMQDLMLQHRNTNMNPRLCLKQLLADKYNLKNEDNRAQPNRKRRRKTPAATTGVTKKTKANASNANAMNNNNSNSMGFNNINSSLMSSPIMHGANGGANGPVGGGAVPNLSLASQDVMVVGEPSMLGADFGDENERRITRLENNQFDASINNNNSNNNNSNLSNSNNMSQQNHNQMCNNVNNQNPTQTNNMNHMQQPQSNNHDTGNIQMMNHMNSNNNNNGNNNTKSSDPAILNNNNGTNCLQGGNNHQQMNLVSMNGNTNHMNHMIKPDMDLKQSTATPTSVESEQAR